MYEENAKFVSNIYRKHTFRGVYTNFISVMLIIYKFGLLHTLFHCCCHLVLDFTKFYIEQAKLKNILSKIAYLLELIDKCIFKFLKTVFQHKPKNETVQKKELRMAFLI